MNESIVTNSLEVETVITNDLISLQPPVPENMN